MRTSKGKTGASVRCMFQAVLTLTWLTSGVGQASDLPTIQFPQFANGSVSGIPNKTRIVLRNNRNQSESGEIRFQDPVGNPALVPIGGFNKTSVDFEIEPWGVFEVSTDGTGPLQRGSIQVWSDSGQNSGLEGTVVFDLLGSKVSLQDSQLRRFNQVYVSRTSRENTGVAAYNPNSALSTTSEVILFDEAGVAKASRRLTLGPGEQFAGFVDEEPLFSDYFRMNPNDFRGTLSINGEYKENSLLPLVFFKLSVVGLLQERTAGNALIAVSASQNAATSFRVWNLVVGTPTFSSSATTLPITVNFQDPSGTASSENVQLFFEIPGTSGYSIAPASGVTAGQTNGTMKFNLMFYGVKFNSGLRIPISVCFKNSLEAYSNELTGTLVTP